MKKLILSLIVLTTALVAKAQQPEAYRLFDAKGKPVVYDQMIKDLSKQDVVFFGEMHNDPICHWLETQVLQSLNKQWKGEMKVGMEMFEADVQPVIDEYFAGVIGSKNFEEESRLWPNYSTDYDPIVEMCREEQIPLIATNVPRRYASVVKNRGLIYLDSLSATAKSYLPPLPVPYASNEQTEEGFALMSMMGKNSTSNPEYLGQSQGLKDVTMAWYISKNLDKKFLHFNGNYHTDANDGIIKYLKFYAPQVTVKTIYSVRQEELTELDETYLGHGDYFICVPETMVTTY